MAALAASLNFIPDRSSRARPFLQFGGCDGSRHTPKSIKQVAMEAAVALAAPCRPRRTTRTSPFSTSSINVRGGYMLQCRFGAREKVKDCCTTTGQYWAVGPDPDERCAQGPHSLGGTEIPVLLTGMPRAGPTRFTSPLALQSDRQCPRGCSDASGCSFPAR